MSGMNEIGTMRVKSGLAEMLKGGVIMDVVDAEQAKIAEEAGACAVMALERVPADIRSDGGVARMSDPDMIRGIQEAVTIPVMAKCRIGHFAEAQILQSLEIDYIDESEVLTPADLEHHVDKWQFTVPFVCGCTNLGEALRRIAEGAAMIRTKGEAGTGDIVNAVTHMRSVFGGIRRLQSLRSEELFAEAKKLRAPYELVHWVAENGRLPVVTFTAGGIATPADAALCMQLGADGVFVGSGIFKSGNPVAARPRDRRGDDALHGRRRARTRVRGPRRGDGRHLDAVARPERIARDAAAGRRPKTSHAFGGSPLTGRWPANSESSTPSPLVRPGSRRCSSAIFAAGTTASTTARGPRTEGVSGMPPTRAAAAVTGPIVSAGISSRTRIMGSQTTVRLLDRLRQHERRQLAEVGRLRARRAATEVRRRRRACIASIVTVQSVTCQPYRPDLSASPMYCVMCSMNRSSRLVDVERDVRASTVDRGTRRRSPAGRLDAKPSVARIRIRLPLQQLERLAGARPAARCRSASSRGTRRRCRSRSRASLR